MGRHSAPDDDGDVLVVDHGVADVDEGASAGDATLPGQPARHAAADTGLARTDVIDPEVVERVSDRPRDVVDAVVVEDETYSVRGPSGNGPAGALTAPRPKPALEPAAAPDGAAKPPKERAGRVDVRLLRESSSLRARCIAAVVLPFVLYTIALVVIGALDAYLFWVWIPAIVAGILFGAQLDGAAKRAASSPDG